MSEPTVLSERSGDIITLTLNRPSRRNALTVDMCAALYEAAKQCADSDARVVILRGAGTDFCAGADLGNPDDLTATPSPTLEELGSIHHAATLLHNMPQITIAAIDGGCAGAGLGYAAACDFRFATPEARFSTAFLKVGVSGDMGLAWSLTRILGGAAARELLLFPEKLSGQDAHKLGLVSRLFARADLHQSTTALAQELCARDPFALRMMKANMLSAEELTLADFVDIETARHLHCTSRPGLRERFAASRMQQK